MNSRDAEWRNCSRSLSFAKLSLRWSNLWHVGQQRVSSIRGVQMTRRILRTMVQLPSGPYKGARLTKDEVPTVVILGLPSLQLRLRHGPVEDGGEYQEDDPLYPFVEQHSDRLGACTARYGRVTAAREVSCLGHAAGGQPSQAGGRRTREADILGGDMLSHLLPWCVVIAKKDDKKDYLGKDHVEQHHSEVCVAELCVRKEWPHKAGGSVLLINTP
eukprot:6610495-Prymnesium_polylepis.1